MIENLKKIILGFLILLCIQLCCNFVVKKFSISFPGALLGAIVFAVLLKFKIINENLVQNVSKIFLKHMGLFFIPLLVGVVDYFYLIKNNLITIILIIFATTFITLVLTALFVENIIKLIKFYNLKNRNMNK